VTGACDCGNEPSGSAKCREFFDWLSMLAYQEELQACPNIRSFSLPQPEKKIEN
jgi:hypothetical protein